MVKKTALIVVFILLAGSQLTNVTLGNFTIPTYLVSPTYTIYKTSDVPLSARIDVNAALRDLYNITVNRFFYSLDNKANVSLPMTFHEDSYSRDAIYSTDAILSGLSDGSHTLTVYANSGGSYVVGSVTFTVACPPNITFIHPENKTYNINTLPLDFSINEQTSWIGYSVDNQANVTVAGNTTLRGLSDGTHFVLIYANDTMGNIEMAKADINIDTYPPYAHILVPENKTYETPNIALSFILTESSIVSYSLDNGANTTISGNTTLAGLSEGAHSIVIYANDTAGNMETSDIVYFTIQANSPTPSSPPISNVFVDYTFPIQNTAIVTTIVAAGIILLFYLKYKRNYGTRKNIQKRCE